MDRLTAAVTAAAAVTVAADPGRPAAMTAYMRGQFAFAGVSAPGLRLILREAAAGLGKPTSDDLSTLALACWARPEREYQYLACAWLRRHVKVCPAEFLDVARTLIVTKSWWDTVDTLAAHVVGPLVSRHAGLVSTMDEWVVDENLWLARTALLHQVAYREATDAQRLCGYCLAQSEHRDFFIRKAIGWALRSYAYTDPEAVRAFVAAYSSRLSPLSVREAMKHL
jgi:3-methyladenine DNA glycosylase AlkD